MALRPPIYYKRQKDKCTVMRVPETQAQDEGSAAWRGRGTKERGETSLKTAMGSGVGQRTCGSGRRWWKRKGGRKTWTAKARQVERGGKILVCWRNPTDGGKSKLVRKESLLRATCPRLNVNPAGASRRVAESAEDEIRHPKGQELSVWLERRESNCAVKGGGIAGYSGVEGGMGKSSRTATGAP